MRQRSPQLSEPTQAPTASVGRIVASVYAPTLLAEIGIGAALPLFALSALDLGLSEAVASLVVMLYAVGRLGGAAVSGVMASRAGVLPATLGGLMVLAAGAALCVVAGGPLALVIGVAVLGAGHAAVHVTRQAQLDLMVPVHARARGLTTLAGVWRIGNFVGPFIGAGLIHAFDLPGGYALACALVLAAAAVYAITAPRHLRVPRAERTKVPVRAVLGPHRRVLTTLGLGVALLGAVRQVRVVVIPLWAEAAGLNAAQTSLIFGIAAAIDMAMFLPAGWVMDRFGRFWTAVPSAIFLTVGIGALPFTHAVWSITAASLLIGLGNGWGSGVVMTLGADAAPEYGRAVFLAAWTNLQDLGGLAGPLIVAGGAAIAVPIGLWAASGIGAGATAALWRWVPRRGPSALGAA